MPTRRCSPRRRRTRPSTSRFPRSVRALPHRPPGDQEPDSGITRPFRALDHPRARHNELMTVTTPLRPGTLSPRRAVPASIARPHYVGTWPDTMADFDDPMVKDADTIARMRVAGRIAADAMVEVGRHVAPGVTTDELDRIGHEFMIAQRRLPVDAAATRTSRSRCARASTRSSATASRTPARSPTATSSRSTSPPTSAACTATPARPSTPATSRPRCAISASGPSEAMLRGIRAVRPGRPDQRHRPGDRVLREALRLRRGARLHRPRRRPELPHQADDPALRRAARDARCSSRG